MGGCRVNSITTGCKDHTSRALSRRILSKEDANDGAEGLDDRAKMVYFYKQYWGWSPR